MTFAMKFLLIMLITTWCPTPKDANRAKTGPTPLSVNKKSSQTQQKVGPASYGSNQSGGHGGRTRNPLLGN